MLKILAINTNDIIENRKQNFFSEKIIKNLKTPNNNLDQAF